MYHFLLQYPTRDNVNCVLASTIKLASYQLYATQLLLSCVVWSYIRSAFEHAHNHIANPQLYGQPLMIVSEHCHYTIAV